MTDSPAAPAALAAFLRGIERRGAVLAELQCGDAIAGDAALAAAMRAFRVGAPAQPMAEWPQRFWTLLLATPRLRQPPQAAQWPDALSWLGRLTPGPRAALLLRLAAGLDEEQAGAVLAVAPGSYRLALRRALPHRDDGRADPAAWVQLREQIHRRIKTLPAERLAHLAKLREAALTGSPVAPAPAAADRPGWLQPVLRGLLAACVLALAATWVWPWWQQGQTIDGIGTRSLRLESPAARYDPALAPPTHRDFGLLADPEGVAQAQDLDFFSWLAAQEVDALPAAAPQAGTPSAGPDAETLGEETLGEDTEGADADL